MLSRRPNPLGAPSLLGVALVSVAFTVACVGGETTSPTYVTPTLGELAPDADGLLDVVDRDAALSGAKEAAEAASGPALDLATVPPGFAMEADSRGLDTTQGYTTGT